MISVINSFACEPEQQENLVRALRDAAPELGALPGIVAATLHRSLDGTRVVNYVQVRSVEDYENLRKVGQTKGYFDRITKFATGKPDAHVYEVVIRQPNGVMS
jgi:quinol monooxygenase YgiN